MLGKPLFIVILWLFLVTVMLIFNKKILERRKMLNLIRNVLRRHNLALILITYLVNHPKTEKFHKWKSIFRPNYIPFYWKTGSRLQTKFFYMLLVRIDSNCRYMYIEMSHISLFREDNWIERLAFFVRFLKGHFWLFKLPWQPKVWREILISVCQKAFTYRQHPIQ